MRIGASVEYFSSADEWVKAHKKRAYGACIFPLSHDAPPEQFEAFKRAANENNLLIAEVGAWSNPLDPNEEIRRAAIKLNIARLQLAETVGARCCVNISGSCHPDVWMAPHKNNLTEETFDQIVRNTQEIIDAVHPTPQLQLQSQKMLIQNLNLTLSWEWTQHSRDLKITVTQAEMLMLT